MIIFIWLLECERRWWITSVDDGQREVCFLCVSGSSSKFTLTVRVFIQYKIMNIELRSFGIISNETTLHTMT